MSVTKPCLILAASFIAGCISPYPQPVARVSEADAVEENKSPRTVRHDWLKKNGSGLNTPKNIADLRLNAGIYRDFYLTQYRDMANTMNASDGGKVIGGLLGVAGALSGSKAMVYQGGGLAGVSAFYTEHYQIKVQSENFLKASDAMRCIERVVAEIPEGMEFTAAGLRVAIIGLEDVIAKLELAQRNIVIAEPNFDRLKNALTKNIPEFNSHNITNDQQNIDASYLPLIEQCVSKF
ncbi:hypothetical protein [Pseudomonas sp. 24 E 1]|uniref:hypothetical protein n=1 Tax=Pseudomonas sp. 24 E 1 TaxID=1844094 RepID=UPI001112994A|nr:hypothetical protein [Pseudomonas sp. 24 E 1]